MALSCSVTQYFTSWLSPDQKTCSQTHRTLVTLAMKKHLFLPTKKVQKMFFAHFFMSYHRPMQASCRTFLSQQKTNKKVKKLKSDTNSMSVNMLSTSRFASIPTHTFHPRKWSVFENTQVWWSKCYPNYLMMLKTNYITSRRLVDLLIPTRFPSKISFLTLIIISKSTSCSYGSRIPSYSPHGWPNHFSF